MGRRLGKAKLPWNPSKSWAGSGAMLLGGWAAAMGLIAYFVRQGYLDADMAPMAGTGGLTAGRGRRRLCEQARG